ETTTEPAPGLLQDVQACRGSDLFKIRGDGGRDRVLPSAPFRQLLADPGPLEAVAVEEGRALHKVPFPLEEEAGERIVRVHPVEGRQQRLEIPHPEGVAVDVLDRNEEGALDLRLGEGAADHLEALAGGERVLPSIGLLGTPDVDQDGRARAVGPDLSDDLEVAPVEGLEAADEESPHGYPSHSLGGQILHVVQELVDVRALRGQVVSAVRAVAVVPGAREVVVEL